VINRRRSSVNRQFIILNVHLCRTKLAALTTIDMPRQNCLSKSAALNKVREGNTIISESVISLQIATQCRTDIYTGMLIFMLVLLCFFVLLQFLGE